MGPNRRNRTVSNRSKVRRVRFLTTEPSGTMAHYLLHTRIMATEFKFLNSNPV